MDPIKFQSKFAELKSTRSWIKTMFIVMAPLLSGVIACNETKEIGPETVGYDYYPIEIGQQRIYDVEEVIFRITGFDTTFYQLRETIFDSIVSLDQTTYLLRRDVRANVQEEWESDSIWSVARTSNYLAITENSVPFIKLTFPVDLSNEWDGNSLNSKNRTTYYYQEVENQLIDSISASNHLRVIIEDIEEGPTGVDLRSEVYVRGIGLVEKDYLTQTICTASSCGEDLGKVTGGRLLKQTLIAIVNE